MIYHENTLYDSLYDLIADAINNNDDIKLESTHHNIVQIASRFEFHDVIANYIRSLNIKDETDFLSDYEASILNDLDKVKTIHDLIDLFSKHQIVDRDSNIEAYADEINLPHYSPICYLNDYITGSPRMFFKEENGKIIAIEHVYVYNYVFHVGDEINVDQLKDCVKRGLYDHLITQFNK